MAYPVDISAKPSVGLASSSIEEVRQNFFLGGSLYARTPQEHDQLSKGSIETIEATIVDFLKQCNFESPHSPPDHLLRKAMATDEVATWNVGLTDQQAAKIVDTSCLFAETAYAHLSPEHRLFVARYTAYFIYADDLGDHYLEALRDFPRRFVNGERQHNPVLERLAEMIKRAHELWTDVGTSAIITGTLDALTAYYIEFTTRGMVVKPGAVRYPDYLRLRTGIDPPFVAFIFMRDWRSTAESYVQLLPDMEYWIGAINDLLSFYKEELEQEVNNYVHLRAAVEQSSSLDILRKLADEILETTRRIDRLSQDDPELYALWRGYAQRFLEFSVKAPRYRLSELGLTA